MKKRLVNVAKVFGSEDDFNKAKNEALKGIAENAVGLGKLAAEARLLNGNKKFEIDKFKQKINDVSEQVKKLEELNSSGVWNGNVKK